MPISAHQLSVREKVGYGLGDTAANFIFQTILVFQLSFYTDTFGITAAAAGTMFLLVRLSDAVTDPLMGIIADRTRTRWGKFRPWILWTAVPFGIMGVLAFTTPDLGPTGKLVYAYVTYAVLMMVYTANNLPYSALSGVMSGDRAERTSISQYRFVFQTIGSFMIQVGALPMVFYLGRGDRALGYQLTMGIFSALAVVFFIITFLSTKERIKPATEQRSSVRQDFSDLIRNGPWLAMFLLTTLVFVTLSLRGGVMLYYFRYFLGREELFSYFNGFSLGATIIAIFFSKSLAVRFGKRNVFLAGLSATAVFTAFFFLLPSSAITLIFVTEMVRAFAYGLTVPLLWAMMGDVADFSEWKNDRRATGVVFAATVFALKAGLGVGGALGGWLLAAFGYVPNVQQTAQALQGIVLTASIFPAVIFLAAAISLFFYRINKRLEIRIADELEERRAQRAAERALAT